MAAVFIWFVGSACLNAQPYAEGGAKRVEIDKATQTLRAYEGSLLVFQSKVSTGKQGKETPNGRFHAESKSLMHYSTLYDNAPMPYSVQINSNYFIHGYSYVPDYPASHGCIRLPIDTARQFYEWISLGTPVEIAGRWGADPGLARAGGRQVRSGSVATAERGRPRVIGNSRPTAVRVERAIPVVNGYGGLGVIPVEE
jgi:hypothetical protein